MHLSKFLRRPVQMIAGADAARSQTSNLLLGKLLSSQVRALGPRRALRDAEFGVFSQFGDDGIIQYLIHNVPIAGQLTFVGGEKRLALISDMMVTDVEHNVLVRLGDT